MSAPGPPPRAADAPRFLPRLLHHVALPAREQAPLARAPAALPTVVFSHGLGGTRLAYSHVCGSLASHGALVVVPEHRDGSAPVAFVRGAPRVEHARVAHTPGPATAAARNRQLEVRLWELALVYAAVAELDAGRVPAGAAMLHADAAARDALLATLAGRLDVRAPGSVVWAGHSFGAATMVQFVKSVYYAPAAPLRQPLFTPDPAACAADVLPLAQQVTATSPLLLLDVWCLPLLGDRSRELWKLPLPQVGAGHAGRVLTIMSDGFFRWKENMDGVQRALTMQPGRMRGRDGDELFADGTADGTVDGPPPKNGERPLLYYVKDSAHLNQSDFGILWR